MVEIIPRRGTDLIEIQVTSDDHQEAKLLSQVIARTYIAERNQKEIQAAHEALKALENELSMQHDIFTEKRTALTKLIGNYGIPYFDAKTASPTTQEATTEVDIDLKATDYNKAKDEYEEARDLFQKMQEAIQTQREASKKPRNLMISPE